MKNKGNFFYKLSFHNKLFLIFLPLIFAFIIITGGACLSISSEQLKLNTEGLMENSVHQTETMIEDKLNTIHLKAVSIVDSSAFKYFVFFKHLYHFICIYTVHYFFCGCPVTAVKHRMDSHYFSSSICDL